MANGRGDPRRGRSRKAKTPITFEIDTSSLNELMAKLGDTVLESLRPVAQAGAQVFYDEVKRNVARYQGGTGNLDKAIYQAYSTKLSTPTNAVYHISWNSRKAPHAHLVEYGHLQVFTTYQRADGKWITDKKRPLATPKQVGARPFVRPATSKAPQAIAAAVAELQRRIAEVTA